MSICGKDAPLKFWTCEAPSTIASARKNILSSKFLVYMASIKLFPMSACSHCIWDFTFLFNSHLFAHGNIKHDTFWCFFQVPEPKDPISNHTYEGVYDWIEFRLLPVLYPKKYYNGKYLTLYDATFILDTISYRVTPLRIAQHRVKPGK